MATCCACGEPTYMHDDTTGLVWIGCDGARERRRLGADMNSRDTIVWCDKHPDVTRDIRAALQVACGPAVAYFIATLGIDDVTNLARKLAAVAVQAHSKADAA